MGNIQRRLQHNPFQFVCIGKRPGYTEMVVTDTLNIPCSNLWIDDDCLYYYSTEWNNNTQSNTIGYGVIDIRTKKVIRDSFISDGTEKDIKIPYGIAVHPVTKDIYVTDAKNYVSSGTLYCYDQDGFQNGVSAQGIYRPIWSL